MGEPVSAAHIDLALALADAAGAVIRPHFRQTIAIEEKGDLTPVTVADRDAEAAMRRIITARYPDHGIIGEEHGVHNPDAELVWVLDPIDGTKAFISGMPTFGTLIALTRRGRPILGVVDQPISGERWLGAAGHPSRLNGREIRTRPCATLGEATIACTTPEMFQGSDADAFRRLRHACKLARYGTDCYAYAVLATGFIDLVVEAELKPYDFCALVPVIDGAGGSITDWQGAPLHIGSDGHALACGDPRLVASARALLANG